MNDPVEKAKKMIESGNPTLVKIGNEILKKHESTKSRDSFIAPIRNTSQNRDVYGEDGQKLGTRMVKEEVKIGKMQYIDDKFTGRDKENELLKKFTTHTPRTRLPVELKSVECYICGKVEKVHPIHTVAKFYRCLECTKKITKK